MSTRNPLPHQVFTADGRLVAAFESRSEACLYQPRRGHTEGGSVREVLIDETAAERDRLRAEKADLLAALKTALDWTEGDLDCPEALDKQTIVERIKFIKTAIARTKGVQS